MRALAARDARFDGLFFVGITSTQIYCRPICPARVSHAEHRRFFDSAGAAERAGFRPCLRCRPELAPGRARVDAVSRLARAAAERIESGALNGRGVTELAVELGVSARHLRRVLERELGVSPGELAQTHRLLLAKRLLSDTDLPVTRIAFASGFQSLRRFNAAFREHYRMPPSALRRERRDGRMALGNRAARVEDLEEKSLRLTLAYREPYDWRGLLTLLSRNAIPGVEVASEWYYARTVRLGEKSGVIQVTNGARASNGAHSSNGTRASNDGECAGLARGGPHLDVEVSASLVPALMPLLHRLRRLFDLDAEPSVIDGHLAATELAPLVGVRPGVRLPGALEPFDVMLGVLVRSSASSSASSDASGERLLRRVVSALGEPIDTAVPLLTHLSPGAERVAEAGAERLAAMGLSKRAAHTLAAVARNLADGTLRLDAVHDGEATHGALIGAGVESALATLIVLRTLYWPDAFPSSDDALLRASGASTAEELVARAERWRPWRAYAALHLWLSSHQHA